MPLPRPIQPNTTYLLTRRCTQRQFLLKPSDFTTQVFLYCLAVAAAKYQVSVHAFVVLSNHYHAVITDNLGNAPDFVAYLNRLVACCINVHLGRSEALFVPGRSSMVKLVDPEAVLDKMIYTQCNPVSSLLVPRSRQWPGLRMDPDDLGRAKLTARRPEVFFRKDGPMPEKATLEPSIPSCFAHEPREAFVGRLKAAIAEREAALREQARAEGKRFLGLGGIRRQKPTGRPASLEPRGRVNPWVAARNKERRQEALGWVRRFVADYREALLRWRQGFRQVVFPAGTYAMVRQHNVAVRAPP